MIPERSRSSVDLPEPLRPTSPTASPTSTWNETPSSATTSRAGSRLPQDEEILERPRLLDVDAEHATHVVDQDLASPHSCFTMNTADSR